MGCGGTQPINPSIEIPGVLGHSPALLYGHISGAAKTMRITYADHTTTTTHLSHGYFLDVLPTRRTTRARRPVRLAALSASGAVTATYNFNRLWIGLTLLPHSTPRPGAVNHPKTPKPE